LLSNLITWANGFVAGNRKMENFKLPDIIQDILNELQEEIDMKKIILAWQINEEHRAYGDQQMIRIVLRNLLDNAIKFSHLGGRIEITAHRQEDKIICAVKDEGTGMDQQKVASLFKSAEVNERGTMGEKGSGLALVLCRDFIKLNNGEIWAESEAGRGSTFYFTLPIDSKESEKSVQVA
jgi:signal transduction histidine kinase